MPAVDLNADVGEEAMSAAEEAELLGLVTSASIACGAHAGSPAVMAATIAAATATGVVIGAHPSYPDRAGFGRRDLDLAPAALAGTLLEQITVLQVAARALGGAVRFVKPHGALYHRACTDESVARVVFEVLEQAAEGGRRAGDLPPDGRLVLLLEAGAPTSAELEAMGAVVVAEAFADRAYRSDGALVPRHEPGAVLGDADAVVAQATSIVLDGRVVTDDGRFVELRAGSLCLHGDTPGAMALARRVRSALEEAGVRVRPFVS